MHHIIPSEVIESKIFLIRKQKIILDRDIASLYGVSTKQINQAVKRNLDRFPNDLMFQLTIEEFNNLKSQFVTSSWGGVRKLPHAFTEYGALMLASVLRSEIAAQVSIRIVRAFVKLKNLLETHKELADKIEELEQKYDYQFQCVFETFKKLLKQEENPKKPIGFDVGNNGD